MQAAVPVGKSSALVFCDMAERQVNPQIALAHLTGGNMEGKETRFGIGSTVLTAITTSNGATGSYNAMHDGPAPPARCPPRRSCSPPSWRVRRCW